MGSIGEHKSYLQQNNFENLDEFDEQVLNDNMIEAQNRQEEFSGGWDFPGIRDSINTLEQKLDKTKSHNTVASIYRQLVSMDTTIKVQYEAASPMEDKNALLTYRRRVRQLLRKIEDMNIL